MSRFQQELLPPDAPVEKLIERFDKASKVQRTDSARVTHSHTGAAVDYQWTWGGRWFPRKRDFPTTLATRESREV